MTYSLIDTSDSYGGEEYDEGAYGDGRAYDGVRANYPYDFDGYRITDDLGVFYRAEVTPLDDIDSRINTLARQQFLDHATGVELNKRARPIGVERQSGESDERLRYRAKVQKVIDASNNTFDDFIAVLEVAFGEDVSSVSLIAATDEPVVIVEAPENVVDALPVTQDELASLLTDAVPLNDRITLSVSGQLLLGGDSFTPSSDSRIGTGELADDQD